MDKNCSLIEPEFGWKEKILFSDIFDLDHFNASMAAYTNGRSIMLPLSQINSEDRVRNNMNLWKYSEKELSKERIDCQVSSCSTKARVLKALRLRPEYEQLVAAHVQAPFTALQVRTESDWVAYAKKKTVGNNETLLINLEDLLKMVAEFDLVGDLFFTSGENHQQLLVAFQSLGVNPYYFYQPNLEYEINAAINFEICCRAHYFIGLSRSSYSNLVALKRALILGNDQSFIYNLNDKIIRRIDKGLQAIAHDSVTKETTIV
nr:hypothetical protein [Echinicola pacifica]